jgi:hypothetical protein
LKDVLALVHAELAVIAASLHPGPGMIHFAVVYQANSMQRIGFLIQRGPGISRRGVLFVAAAARHVRRRFSPIVEWRLDKT